MCLQRARGFSFCDIDAAVLLRFWPHNAVSSSGTREAVCTGSEDVVGTQDQGMAEGTESAAVTAAASSLSSIRRIVLVLSGKGGVGKSTTAVQIALALAAGHAKVGLLDVDLCGPSIARMLGLEGSPVYRNDERWLPVAASPDGRLVAMSMAFLLANKEDAVVWRGPKKNAMIKEFVHGVQWGDLDYLVVDTPPGTSDEHMAVVESFRGHHDVQAVLVTTPQQVAVADVRREISFCKQLGISVTGIVENMSGYVCPCCNEITNIFSSGGGERLASETHVPFLGKVPIDPRLAGCSEQGQSFAVLFAGSPTQHAVQRIVEHVTAAHPVHLA
eukprot:m.15248 g.15248  ORF g.15248 m.15248 type:complete len:330 (+) comp7348_c0_seq1:1225-2214(+)